MNYQPAKRMDSLPFSGIRAVMEKATKMQQAGEKVIHMEIGRPDFDTPEKIKAAANASLAKGNVFILLTMELRSFAGRLQSLKKQKQRCL